MRGLGHLNTPSRGTSWCPTHRPDGSGFAQTWESWAWWQRRKHSPTPALMAAAVECHEGQGGGPGFFLSPGGWSNKEMAATECSRVGEASIAGAASAELKRVDQGCWDLTQWCQCIGSLSREIIAFLMPMTDLQVVRLWEHNDKAQKMSRLGRCVPLLPPFSLSLLFFSLRFSFLPPSPFS